MAEGLDFSDRPIAAPEQDLFGVFPFAKSLARSVAGMKSPEGVVLAINGPWGAGKSSVINLLKGELASVPDLVTINFNPWWFRGEDALAMAFFRQLYAALKPSLGERAKKTLPRLGARLLKAGGAVGPAVDLAGGSGLGSLASGTLAWLSDMIEQDESVEKLHAELSDALAGQTKRFVVLIDDIDRLSPDEALAMFRLVKSVGRLPNVIYVLAFDRALAEKVVQERYPSEGPHYLEKIIQAGFEVPTPNSEFLKQSLLNQIFAIIGQVEDAQAVHFMNLFYQVVAPEVRTPRDLTRFLNALSVTWPAVAGDVDQGDFVALEAYRVFRPAIYNAVRQNAAILTGGARSAWGHSEIKGEELDRLLLASVQDVQSHRAGLMRLFPKLESIWSNTFHSSDGDWERQRRACSPSHFQTYFSFSPVEGVLSGEQTRALLATIDKREELQAVLLEASKGRQSKGTSRVPLVLDALTAEAPDIEIEKVAPLLSAVFQIADQIHVEVDRGRPFEDGTTSLRLHWLLRALTRGRTTLAERSDILMRAVEHAELGWFVDFAMSAWTDYHPREGKSPEPEESCLVVPDAASRLRERSLAKIKAAAEGGTLIDHHQLAFLLFVWIDHGEDEGALARAWVASQMDSDHGLAQLARALTSYSWVQGMGMFGLGDLVSKRLDRASIDSLDQFLDPADFRRRLEQMVGDNTRDDQDAQAVRRFLAAWDRQERDPW